MKAFLYKDLTLGKIPLMILTAAIALFWVIMGNEFFLYNGTMFFLLVALVFAYMYTGYTTSIDENSGFCTFAFSSPLSRKAYVLSKYLPFFGFSFLFATAAVLFELLFTNPYSNSVTYALFPSIFSHLYFFLFYTSILSSFLLPLIFKFGVKIGSMLFFLLLCIVAVFYTSNRINISILFSFSPPLSIIINILSILLPVALSLLLSFHIISKKEY